MSVIPKSVTPSRIESNFKDTTLTEEEFEAISQVGLKEPIRYNVPFNYKVKWDINIFGRWTDLDAETGWLIFWDRYGG